MPAVVTIKGKRIINVQWIVILLFIVWPLGALPFILMEIWNRRPYAFTLLALFMGFCAVLFPPGGDLYRHTLNYFAYQSISWDSFRSLVSSDFVLQYVSFFFAKAGINFEIIRFLFVFACYYIWFYLFRSAAAYSEVLSTNRYWYIVGFLLVFLNSKFFTATMGLRYALATAVIILAAWRLLVQNRKYGYIWLLLAPMIHIGTLMFSIGVPLVKTGLFRLNNRSVSIVIFVVGYLASSVVMHYIVSLLGGLFIGGYFDIYVDGYWGAGGVKNDLEADNKLYSLVLMIKQAVMLLLLFAHKDRSPYRRSILMIFILWGLTIPFYALGFRVSSVLTYLILFWIIMEFDRVRRSMGLFVAVFSFSLLIFFADILGNRYNIARSRADKFLYCPAPVLMFNTFDEEWVGKHVENDGRMRR